MSQIQEAYQTLAEIDKLLADIELKISKITDSGTREKLERTRNTFIEVERLALRWLVLAKRMGLPEDVDMAVSAIAQLITMIRMAQIAMNLAMASNPLTAAIGVAGLIGVAYSTGDLLAGY